MARGPFHAAPYLVALALALAGAGTIYALPNHLALWREPALDRLLPLTPKPVDAPVAVVDLGMDGARVVQNRADLAELLVALGEAGASGVALDIVLSANCGDLPENVALTQAIADVPTTLGFLLSAADGGAPEKVPTLAAGQGLALPEVWQAAGAESACPAFQDAALGSGVASLSGGEDGVVRDAPVLAVSSERAYLGLAFEAVRQREELDTVIIGGDPAWLRLGPRLLDIGPTARLRFRPSDEGMRVARTFSVEAVLSRTLPADALGEKLVFVGNSDPGAGALRATPASPLYPSVQIHADMASGLLTDTWPKRPAWAGTAEAGMAFAGGIVAGAAGAVLSPFFAGLLFASLAMAWLGATLLGAGLSGMLIDPVAPVATLLVAGSAALLVQAAYTRQAEAVLRRRIGQLLPPDVVARFVRHPELLRLEGEEREVTALFTDIEGFSQTLHGIEPKRFVLILDAYFTGMTRIVLDHGGMIDKLVGDAVHALFNAPADLDGHVDKAIVCALAMQIFAEEFRARPEMVEIRFGRTRIGIETGRAILGDVGANDKIDYTAHGPAINLAARLEAANKELGTAICIGPTAAAKATLPLRALGEVEVRGFGPVAVHTTASVPP